MKIKIFKMNECDWVAAENLDDAKECLANHLGVTVQEAEDEPYFEDPCEEPEDNLNKLKMRNEDGQDIGTFQDELDRLIEEGQDFPMFFASTEY